METGDCDNIHIVTHVVITINIYIAHFFEITENAVTEETSLQKFSSNSEAFARNLEGSIFRYY